MDNINPGIRGNTFDVIIDTENNRVTLGGEVVIDGDHKLTQTFLVAYRMGRDHKKQEIRKVLNVV